MIVVPEACFYAQLTPTEDPIQDTKPEDFFTGVPADRGAAQSDSFPPHDSFRRVMSAEGIV